MVSLKQMNIKDVAFISGFIATLIWGIASFYSIKASKTHIERLKKELKNEQSC